MAKNPGKPWFTGAPRPTFPLRLSKTRLALAFLVAAVFGWRVVWYRVGAAGAVDGGSPDGAVSLWTPGVAVGALARPGSGGNPGRRRVAGVAAGGRVGGPVGGDTALRPVLPTVSRRGALPVHPASGVQHTEPHGACLSDTPRGLGPATPRQRFSRDRPLQRLYMP